MSSPSLGAVAKTGKLFLIRGLVAIAWAVAFVLAADSSTNDVPVGAGILLVIYPLIDLLSMLSIHVATGRIEFVIQAWLLARRPRRVATLPARA